MGIHWAIPDLDLGPPVLPLRAFTFPYAGQPLTTFISEKAGLVQLCGQNEHPDSKSSGNLDMAFYCLSSW